MTVKQACFFLSRLGSLPPFLSLSFFHLDGQCKASDIWKCNLISEKCVLQGPCSDSRNSPNLNSQFGRAQFDPGWANWSIFSKRETAEGRKSQKRQLKSLGKAPAEEKWLAEGSLNQSFSTQECKNSERRYETPWLPAGGALAPETRQRSGTAPHRVGRDLSSELSLCDRRGRYQDPRVTSLNRKQGSTLARSLDEGRS